MKMYLPPRAESRRGFLKKGLIGGALLAAGGASFLALKPTVEVPLPPEGLQALTPREYSVLVAITRRIIPSRPGFPSPDELRVAFQADRVLTKTDETSRAEVRQLLMLFENALSGLLFGGRTKPFTALDAAEQDRVLEEWSRSPITLRRTGFLALRVLVTAAYYGNPATWPAVAYPGPLPGIHDANAPVWKGGGEPRPIGNGTYIEAAEPVKEATP